MTRNMLLTAVLGLLLGTSVLARKKQAPVHEYQLDTKHSHIGFTVRHLGISRVKGTFGDFEGQIQAREDGTLVKVVGVVKTASVNTGNEGRDDHLRQDDFFNAEQFPEMRLETTRIQRRKGNRLRAHANLTIRDKTLPVVLKGEFLGGAKVNFGKKQHRMGFTATTKIDRQKFGLRFNKIAEGVRVVGNEVTIQLEVEVSRNLE